MLVGGIVAILLQILHPKVLGGVKAFSTVETDVIGRLRRTAHFISVTTWGSRHAVTAALAGFHAVHRRIEGTLDDGSTYSGLDPDLLAYVHHAELFGISKAARAFGPHHFDAAVLDAYVADLRPLAIDLGAHAVAGDTRELEGAVEAARPLLRCSANTLEMLEFLRRGVSRRPHEILAYDVVFDAAVSLLPAWAAAELGIEHRRGVDRALVDPAAHGTFAALRWLMGSSATAD
jgi:uncharacterized protein (DUF2236 family)